jgi:pSer/pThr/pTyr-binding forkhead associated (FHA) protein
MTTETHPKPFGPAAPARSPERPTQALEPADSDSVLDALPLLDHRTRRQTVAPGLAPRGHYLALEDGPHTRMLRIEDKVTHLGRGGDADIRFDEHRVSRGHAILVRHGHHFRLLDNRSSNGTYVNGRQINSTNIEDGDVILLGPVAMQFLVVG